MAADSGMVQPRVTLCKAKPPALRRQVYGVQELNARDILRLPPKVLPSPILVLNHAQIPSCDRRRIRAVESLSALKQFDRLLGLLSSSDSKKALAFWATT